VDVEAATCAVRDGWGEVFVRCARGCSGWVDVGVGVWAFCDFLAVEAISAIDCVCVAPSVFVSTFVRCTR